MRHGRWFSFWYNREVCLEKSKRDWEMSCESEKRAETNKKWSTGAKGLGSFMKEKQKSIGTFQLEMA